jgi:Fe-S-cluster containining protein
MIAKDVAAERLAMAARDSLSSYCYSECKAHCCRKGHLLLTAGEVDLLKDTHKEDLKMISVQAKTHEKRYVFRLESNVDGCPNLLNYKCMIHKNPARPKACREFPIFIRKNKTLTVTRACPAVKENKLYPYLAEFKMMGYALVYLPGKD